MKAIIIYLLLVGLAVRPVFAQNKEVAAPAALEEKYGFRDAVFDTDTTAFTDLNQLGFSSEEGLVRRYWRTNDPKKIGDATIEEIAYTFYKGKLYGILITTTNHADSQELLRVLVAKYGPGTQDNPANQHFLWLTKRVVLLYQEGSLTGKGQVTIASRVVSARKEADDAARAKKAASDL